MSGNWKENPSQKSRQNKLAAHVRSFGDRTSRQGRGKGGHHSSQEKLVKGKVGGKRVEAKEVCVEPNETLTRRERKAEATNPKDDNRDGEASEASGEHSRHILASN